MKLPDRGDVGSSENKGEQVVRVVSSFKNIENQFSRKIAYISSHFLFRWRCLLKFDRAGSHLVIGLVNVRTTGRYLNEL